jgi:hypothetical protein
MDTFIGPLVSYEQNPPDQKAVEAAYRAFISDLSIADEPGNGMIRRADDHLTPIETPSGLIYVITKHGEGRQPQAGEIAVVRMTGFTGNGVEFRQTKAGSDLEPVTLVDGVKIPGLLEGICLMHVGDSAIFVIPPTLAYGAFSASGGKVPPYSTLTYFVDLTDVRSKHIFDVMKKTIETDGIDAALEQYRQLKKLNFPDVYKSEIEINHLGYQLLSAHNPEGAIKFFELNLEAYPKSANVYNSLGDAYAAKGDKQRAIENYQKALAIDPTMKYPADAIKRLQSATSQ